MRVLIKDHQNFYDAFHIFIDLHSCSPFVATLFRWLCAPLSTEWMKWNWNNVALKKNKLRQRLTQRSVIPARLQINSLDVFQIQLSSITFMFNLSVVKFHSLPTERERETVKKATIAHDHIYVRFTPYTDSGADGNSAKRIKINILVLKHFAT